MDMMETAETQSVFLPFLGWMIGILLYHYWEISKWLRDQRREGRDVTIKSYLDNYKFLTWIVLALAISLFWAWHNGLGFSLFGFEVELPFIPSLSWFMGFGAIGFAQHAVKSMRNFLNRVKGEPV